MGIIKVAIGFLTGGLVGIICCSIKNKKLNATKDNLIRDLLDENAKLRDENDEYFSIFNI